MERQPTVVLTLLAGLWMLGSGGMMYHMTPGFLNGQGSWMWGHGMMRGMMGIARPGASFLWLGGVAGIVLLVGSVFLYSKPETSRTWGLVILCVSVLNLFFGMGGVLAAALGVIGGALAMTWQPPRV